METNKIYMGDCLRIMHDFPDKSIDLVVTDPPYNLNYAGRGEWNKFDNFANDNLSVKEHSLWFDTVLMQLYRVLKYDTAIYIYIDFRNYPRIYNLVEKYFAIKNCIVWVKNNFGMGQHYRFQHEFCIYAVKGDHKLQLDKRNQSDVWKFKKEDVNSYRHPTQKPVFAMFKPIEFSSQPGGIVLDPFAGSGTTCVAAKELGRQYVGIELESQYVDVAKSRLMQGYLF